MNEDFKFAPGDYVYIRTCTAQIYSMQKRVGTVVRISNQYMLPHNIKAYLIEDDNGSWLWEESWLDLEKNIQISEKEFEEIFNA